MEAIVIMSHERKEKLTAVYTELLAKTKGYSVYRDLFENYTRKPGYAHYVYSGKISDKLVELLGREPTSDEVIMLVDSGFSHFGATCTISGRNFSGRVNTD